jgi:4-aminobutyrate aminotransferase-like enzyme
MTLEEMGAIGDLASAVGVIVSLLYLARQVHQANHANQASTSNAVSTFFAAQLLQMGTNRALCELLIKQGRGERLDDADRLQATFVLRSQLIAFENYYHQHTYGLMDRAGWESRRQIAADMLRNPTARAIWDDMLSKEQHPGFAREMQDELARGDVRQAGPADERSSTPAEARP